MKDSLPPGTAQELNEKFDFRKMLLAGEQIGLIRRFIAEARWIWAKTYAKTVPPLVCPKPGQEWWK